MIERLTFWLGEGAADAWAEHLAKVERDAAEMKRLQETVDE